MRKPVLADTGPLYALADPADRYHLQAHEQLGRLTAGGRFVAITYLTFYPVPETGCNAGRNLSMGLMPL